MTLEEAQAGVFAARAMDRDATIRAFAQARREAGISDADSEAMFLAGSLPPDDVRARILVRTLEILQENG